MAEEKDKEPEVLTDEYVEGDKAEEYNEFDKEVLKWFKEIISIKSITEIGKIILDSKIEQRRIKRIHYRYSLLCLSIIVIAVVFLSFYDLMNPAAGVILGSLAGYLFGKQSV